MWCGCFHCLQVFDAAGVVDWIDDGETPLCPRCGVDAVMAGVTDIMELLTMQRMRFPRGDLDRRERNASDTSNDD